MYYVMHIPTGQFLYAGPTSLGYPPVLYSEYEINSLNMYTRQKLNVLNHANFMEIISTLLSRILRFSKGNEMILTVRTAIEFCLIPSGETDESR